MSVAPQRRGVFVPAVTPFLPDFTIDTQRLVTHCRWLLEEGANGLAVFGTTSEANSLSVTERIDSLEALIDRGIAPGVLMPGTGCCALPDTVLLTRHAVEHGCFGVLLLPPFYYKSISDDGLFAGISEVIQRVADPRLRVYLYHIPGMSGVSFSVPVIERLLKRFPGIVVGLKDSSGDWQNTKTLLQTFPGFEIFPGNEGYLLDALRLGGAGCISATANVNVAAIQTLLQNWQTPQAEQLQRDISSVRNAIAKFAFIPACKAILAQANTAPSWNVLRPPLLALDRDSSSALHRALDEVHFHLMPTAATA
jgi:4-hydroxy-tetrahydrodipicolinate synthase